MRMLGFVGDGRGIFSSMAIIGSRYRNFQNPNARFGFDNLYSLSYAANTLHIRTWLAGAYKVSHATLVLEKRYLGIEMNEVKKQVLES